MSSLGKRKLSDAAPNRPWAHQTTKHTCIDFGRQPIAELRPIKPDNMRKVVGNSCPACHGSIVELVGHLPEYQGRRDLATIRHIDGSVCALPWNDLGPTVDPRYAEQRAKLENFDGYRDAVEFYDSLTDKQKAELKAQGIC